MNLATVFFQKAAEQPQQWLILGPRDTDSIRYGEFSQRVQSLATRLRELGVKPGDNVGLHYPNGSDYIAYNYALWACGACVTPIPVELAEQEKQRIFQFIQMDSVISATRLFRVLESLAREPAMPFTDGAVLLPVTSACQRPAALSSVNAAFIRFTSGTTDRAKGVVLSHETIYRRIHVANEAMQLQPEERVLWLLSMAYHFAVSIVAYLSFGATIVLPRNSFGVSLLQAANQHHVTLIYAAPNHYQMMLSDNTGQTLPDSLRLVVVTTTALNPGLANAFYQRFGRVLNETYGIIELGLPAVNVSHSPAKQGSVGKPLSGYELTLERHEAEESGEVLVRGDAMLDAYYSPWQSRDDILQENQGWFRTGDLGRFDAEGFLYLVGRNKELISVAGMKFFPQEVERVLETHPAIHTACVLASKSAQAGEIPVAQLVLEAGNTTPSIDELRLYCQQHLASYKVPVQFHWVDELSYTASGKLVRRAI